MGFEVGVTTVGTDWFPVVAPEGLAAESMPSATVASGFCFPFFAAAVTVAGGCGFAFDDTPEVAGAAGLISATGAVAGNAGATASFATVGTVGKATWSIFGDGAAGFGAAALNVAAFEAIAFGVDDFDDSLTGSGVAGLAERIASEADLLIASSFDGAVDLLGIGLEDLSVDAFGVLGPEGTGCFVASAGAA